MGDDGSCVLELDSVRLVRGDTVILDGLSWRVRAGEHWAVVGPNGSGKTTMLKVATGAMWPTAGQVSALGVRYGTVDLREFRRRIGWVSSALEEWILPGEKALDVVVSGAFASFGLYREPVEKDRRRAAELLDFLACGRLFAHAYGTLSQGEKQKVLIARALMPDADILILDEAAAGLDIRAREVLLESVDKLARSPGGPALIFVTHHIEEIVPAVTHAVILASGRVLAAGAKAQVLTGPMLARAFGVQIEVDARHGRFWPRVANSFPAAPGEGVQAGA